MDNLVKACLYDMHARNIVDTRNRIIHGYDAVSDEVIWGIVINYLPVLDQEIRLLLGE